MQSKSPQAYWDDHAVIELLRRRELHAGVMLDSQGNPTDIRSYYDDVTGRWELLSPLHVAYIDRVIQRISTRLERIALDSEPWMLQPTLTPMYCQRRGGFGSHKPDCLGTALCASGRTYAPSKCPCKPLVQGGIAPKPEPKWASWLSELREWRNLARMIEDTVGHPNVLTAGRIHAIMAKETYRDIVTWEETDYSGGAAGHEEELARFADVMMKVRLNHRLRPRFEGNPFLKRELDDIDNACQFALAQGKVAERNINGYS